VHHHKTVLGGGNSFRKPLMQHLVSRAWV